MTVCMLLYIHNQSSTFGVLKYLYRTIAIFVAISVVLFARLLLKSHF